MAFFPSDDVDNENCVSLLLQILEDPTSDELYPVFYIAAPGYEFLDIQCLTAISQGLAHAKHKIDNLVETLANE